MKQKLIEVRVRPQRFAVLISKTGSSDNLMLAIKLLSRLWGGRFCQILAVDPDGDDLTLQRLAQSRPEFVYFIGVENNDFLKSIENICHPRAIGKLTAKYVDNLHMSLAGHITAAHVIHHIRRTPIGRYERERALKILGCSETSPLRRYVGALFGVHYENLTAQVIAYEGEFIEEDFTPVELIKRHTSFVQKTERCWLDVIGHGLSPVLFGQMDVPPTIVVVGSEIPDLSLFWNLRSAIENNIPGWIIPLPVSSLDNDDILPALKEWLLSFESLLGKPNFCNIISESIESKTLADFAKRLQSEFQDTPIEHVDVVAAPDPIPFVVGFEREEQLLIQKSAGRISLHPPVPTVVSGQSSQAWMLDFVQEVKTHRALEELNLPHRESAVAVLNAPGPRSFTITGLQRLGIGADVINLRCSSSKSTGFHTPTAFEVITECLIELGIEPQTDEKRLAYRPVIKLFGGLQKAADAFTGKRWLILQEFLNGPRSVEELRGNLKLGKGELPELDSPGAQEHYLKPLNEKQKRITRRRLERHRARLSPDSNRLPSLLEFWADQGILQRQWSIGPCKNCLRTFPEPRLNISKSVRCPGCAARIYLPQKVSIVYGLHRAVAHALREGLAPVVLTARFLRSLTNNGFLWLPGLKYKWNEKDGDIDVPAICDGHLVFAECKTLDETPDDANVWTKVINQFKDTIAVAEHCRAEVVVLASFCEEFPKDVVEKIQKLIPKGMGHLLLNRNDLELGHRDKLMSDGKSKLWQTMFDVIPQPEKAPPPKVEEPRQIVTPLCLKTFAGPNRSSSGRDTEIEEKARDSETT